MMHLMTCNRPKSLLTMLGICLALSFASGCGSSGENNLLKSGPVPTAVTEAETVNLADFPKADGTSLVDITKAASGQGDFAQANAELLPGMNRVAFGVVKDGVPLYGPSVVYIAKSPRSPAQGPFPAPADPLVPQAPYLSKGAALDTAQLKAIYEAQVPLPAVGKWWVVTMTKSAGTLVQTTYSLPVVAKSKIPNVGQRPPTIQTWTNAQAAKGLPVDTRDPKAPTLHERSFANVVGMQPVALLFSSPQFCQSRVCGPVTDLLLQLQQKYSGSLIAIQQEAYGTKPPAPSKPMVDFGLVSPNGAFTEPWLFAVGRDGLIKARLEGAFGINAMNAALKAAIKP